jgi:hypothetical protein
MLSSRWFLRVLSVASASGEFRQKRVRPDIPGFVKINQGSISLLSRVRSDKPGLIPTKEGSPRHSRVLGELWALLAQGLFGFGAEPEIVSSVIKHVAVNMFDFVTIRIFSS